MALIDRETFGRVQARIAERGALYVRTNAGRLLGRPRLTDGDPRYLLTGLLRCTCCDGALGPMLTGGGRWQRRFYRCSAHHHRGRVGCRNGLRVSVEALDAAVLDAVSKALEPATVTEAVRQAVDMLTAGQGDARSRRAAITSELDVIRQRERRLLDSLMDAEGDAAGAIKGRLRDELARRDALAEELARLDVAPAVDVDKLVTTATERARDLRGLLGRHPTQARQVIRALLAGERWDAEPFEDASGRGYRLRVVGDYRRLMGREFASLTVGHFASTLRWCWTPRPLIPSSTTSPGCR